MTVKCNPTIRRHSNLSNLMDEIFNYNIGDFWGSDLVKSTPNVNVTETKDTYEIHLAAPGLEKENFQIGLDKGLIHIQVSKETTTEQTDFKFRRREFDYRSFKRSFRLPNSVDASSITANYEQGILTVSLPKKEEAKTPPARNIEIA